MSNDYIYTVAELEALFEDAKDQIDTYRSLSDELTLRRVKDGSWSIHEICDHLVVFGNLYLEEMDKAISKANPVPQKKGPFRPRWHFRKMASLFEPPYKMKMKTLPPLQPSKTENLTETFDKLSDIQANVLYILEQAGASRWNLKKIKGKNPVYRFLSMNLIEYMVMIDVHQRRHFWQIEQLLSALNEN